MLYDLPLFTKVSVETPMTSSLPIPSDACFVYIVEGDGQTFRNHQTKIEIKNGQVILSLCGLTAGEMIAQQPKGSIDSVIVHFHPKQLKQVFENEKPQLWQELETPVTQYVVQYAANNLIKLYFDGVNQLFQNKSALTESILSLKLKEIILLLLQTEDSEAVRQIMRSLFSERVFSFKELVDAHIFLPISIENLAMLTNHSLSSFKRRFREIYHDTPGSYIMSKRLEKVANLLKITTEPVSAVGYDCGFNSPEHLSRAFKKHYGLSPTEYRKNFSVK